MHTHSLMRTWSLHICIDVRFCCVVLLTFNYLWSGLSQKCFTTHRGQHQRLSERQLATGVGSAATNHHQNHWGHSAGHSKQDLPLHTGRIFDIGHCEAGRFVCVILLVFTMHIHKPNCEVLWLVLQICYVRLSIFDTNRTIFRENVYIGTIIKDFCWTQRMIIICCFSILYEF